MFLHQADILTPTHLEPLDLLDPLHIHMVQKITFSYHLLSPWHLFLIFFLQWRQLDGCDYHIPFYHHPHSIVYIIVTTQIDILLTMLALVRYR